MKLFFVVIGFAMVTTSYAQTIGVKAGLNLSDMLFEDDYDSDETFDHKLNPGFHLGATVEFPLFNAVSFEAGAILNTKGVKLSFEEDDFYFGEYSVETSMRLFYLDIPLHAKATFDIGTAKLYGNIGPYVGIGLSGTAKSEITFAGETETEEYTYEWGSDEEEDDLKRLDYGLSMGAGIEINALQIGINYAYGLANISAYTEDGNKLSNRVLNISVGYKFGGN